MSFIVATLWIAVAGAVGGALNALITDNGFALPRSEQPLPGMTILRPGVIGNVLIGAVSAITSWYLYGPVKDLKIGASPISVTITPGELAAALLVGVAGAKWLTNEVDKKLLRAAGAIAAAARPSAEADAHVKSMLLASPAEALAIARTL